MLKLACCFFMLLGWIQRVEPIFKRKGSQSRLQPTVDRANTAFSVWFRPQRAVHLFLLLKSFIFFKKRKKVIRRTGTRIVNINDHKKRCSACLLYARSNFCLHLLEHEEGTGRSTPGSAPVGSVVQTPNATAHSDSCSLPRTTAPMWTGCSTSTIHPSGSGMAVKICDV